MSKLIDITGKKFNYFTVLHRDFSKRKRSEARWICECVCGKKVSLNSADIRRGRSKSCGCKRHLPTTKHNLSSSPTYRIYKGMIQRCYNPNTTGFHYYGGRGIKVSEEWLDKEKGFYIFLKDMGERPSPTYSLDRIDSNGNYCKENCKWATPQEQWDNRKQINLTAKSYQFKTAETAIYPNNDKLWSITYCLLGIASESGEISGKYKKMIRDNGFELSAEVKKSLIDEAGDLMWYISQLCTELDVSLDYVLKNNLRKLSSRKQRGVLKGSGDNR